MLNVSAVRHERASYLQELWDTGVAGVRTLTPFLIDLEYSNLTVFRVSMLRTQQIERATDSHDRFLLIHGASRSVDFGPYRGELEELSRLGWLSYLPTISRPWAEPDWKGETGRIEDVVRKHADQLGFDSTNTVTYACGHPGMIENVKGILARTRFRKEQIREEEYFKLHYSHSPDKPDRPVAQKDESVVHQGRCRSLFL